MSLKTNIFRFEEFVLDTKEKTLVQNGEVVSITPKAFQLLLVLIQNHGRLVTREDLMQAVWAESFVEEGNLTFTINLLRKALKDSSQNPRFIKTIPLSGYKFIAEVQRDSAENEFLSEEVKQSIDRVDTTEQKSKKLYRMVVAFTVPLLFGAIALGIWYLQSKKSIDYVPVLELPFTTEKLSTDGNVYHAAVSPDGKTIVYTNGIVGKQSVWMREMQSGNNIEIIPQGDYLYGGLAFSPDGNYFYFAKAKKNSDRQMEIFRISIFGGVPTKIVSETQGWIGVSPDGSKVSFVRCFYLDDENCSLWIADAKDGKNERKLISRPKPFRIGENEFSPDGKSVAFAFGQSENQSNEFGLAAVEIESGQERELISEKFFNIKHFVWLPDNDGLLISAAKIPNRNYRIWHIIISKNEAKPLTKDSEDYGNLSLNKDSRFLISTQVKSDFRLTLFSMENPSFKNVFSEGESASFSRDGKIVFSSQKSGNMEIWGSESNGTRQIQLTNDSGDDIRPIVSPDNNFIFFASNRSGEVQVWRMNSDGSNQIQVTKRDGGFPLLVSPDGSRVFYHHGRSRTLWSVSDKGSDEQLVLNEQKSEFSVSPDGLQVAFSENQDENKILVILSLTDKTITKRFNTAVEKNLIRDIEWMPDGKSVLYFTNDSKSANNILWTQKLGDEKPQKIADFSDEGMSVLSGFAISPDGKSFTISRGIWRHDAVLLKGLK